MVNIKYYIVIPQKRSLLWYQSECRWRKTSIGEHSYCSFLWISYLQKQWLPSTTPSTSLKLIIKFSYWVNTLRRKVKVQIYFSILRYFRRMVINLICLCSMVYTLFYIIRYRCWWRKWQSAAVLLPTHFHLQLGDLTSEDTKSD